MIKSTRFYGELRGRYWAARRWLRFLYRALMVRWSWVLARMQGLPGHRYFGFGRKLGWRLLRRGDPLGWMTVLVPVSSTRYFEFDFAERALPSQWQSALDVGSPWLFTLHIARRFPARAMLYANPDSREADQLSRAMAAMPPPLAGIVPTTQGVEALAANDRQFDVVWSLSVLEHIDRDGLDDCRAVELLYARVRPGGCLILTVPTDRRAWREMRAADPYGTQPLEVDPASGRREYFFQRFYTEASLRERIIGAIGVEPVVLAWYGETEPGRFMAYVDQWLKRGHVGQLDDPREFARHYRVYPNWNAMPGVGVCGMVFEKPR